MDNGYHCLVTARASFATVLPCAHHAVQDAFAVFLTYPLSPEDHFPGLQRVHRSTRRLRGHVWCAPGDLTAAARSGGPAIRQGSPPTHYPRVPGVPKPNRQPQLRCRQFGLPNSYSLWLPRFACRAELSAPLGQSAARLLPRAASFPRIFGQLTSPGAGIEHSMRPLKATPPPCFSASDPRSHAFQLVEAGMPRKTPKRQTVAQLLNAMGPPLGNSQPSKEIIDRQTNYVV
ncbi:hypothetical protein T310_7569 [Rasamsonia emersonii CBS 393.64]|uniref:Uncharacterized protein n=1 Tax=Rasamsonia emersonii (strain ATCC 16479 / CBS 393.64 / IMI 116815) TaxID=1408163 RepID=A0A0F4YJK3_RASE3|nr:hypothetical protein T310_7569 [Rasamsonia emersonii CBS 393.64]KKA18472.1 hypothetical protein T310_7569 [Rasamsonia emersonii CBS 393.64]